MKIRNRSTDNIPKENLDKLKLPELKEVGKPQVWTKREYGVNLLKWRSYRENDIAWLRRTKRVKIVRTTKKKKEVYTISGLTRSEASKVVEALR